MDVILNILTRLIDFAIKHKVISTITGVFAAIGAGFLAKFGEDIHDFIAGLFPRKEKTPKDGHTNRRISQPVPYTDKHLKRDNEEAIRSAIQEGGQKILIYGDSGLGKSHLAQRFYNELSKSGDAYWVSYQNDLRSSLLSTISVDCDSTDENMVFQAIIQKLQENRKTVLFVDNVTKVPQEDKWLRAFTGLPITVVLTSQKRVMDGYDRAWEIRKLTPKEAEKLFDTFYRGKRKKNDLLYVQHLAELAHFNTLTLKHIAQTADVGISLKNYSERLGKLDRKSLDEVLEILFSMTNLQKEHQRIIWNFAVMPAVVIPADIAGWIDCHPDDLERLVEADWLEHRETGYYLHDLKRQAVCVHKAPDTALSAFIDCVADDKFFADFGTEHYTTVLRKIQIAEAVLEAYGVEDEQFAYACHNLASALDDMASYDPALDWYQQALDIKKCVLGEKHWSVAKTHNNMGLVYQRKGDYDEALAQYKLALDIKKCVLGEKHWSVANTHVGMGVVYQMQGDYDKALAQYRLALNIYDKDSKAAADTYNNMGNVYDDQGNSVDALAQYALALKIYLNVYGENHPSTASTYNNIGAALVELNRYKETAVLDARAYGIRLQRLGPDHPDTKDSMDNLHIDYNRLHPSADFDPWFADLRAEADAIPDFTAWLDDLLNKINTESTPTT